MTDERSTTWEERVALVREARAAVEVFDTGRALPEGALSPRGRIAALLDGGSFLEMGALSRSQHDAVADRTPADGAITGYGTIDGREVAVIAEDPLALAATDAQVAKAKRSRLIDQVVYRGIPLVYLADGAARPYPTFPAGEGLMHLRGADQYWARDIAERSAPFVAVVFGVCRGQDAVLATAADVVVATSAAGISLTESDGRRPDAADVVASDDREAIELAKRVLSLIPDDASSPLTPVVAPSAPASPLDDAGGDVVEGVFDDGTVVRFAGGPAGVAAVDGLPVAFFAAAGGTPLDGDAVARLHRVAAISRRHRIPLLVTQDCAGYGPSVGPRDVRALVGELHASDAVKISIVTGRGHVLGDFVLGGRGCGYDVIWAWPTAQISTGDARVYEPGTADAADGPWAAADLGIVDDVILPSETRAWLVRALRTLALSRAVPPARYDRGTRLLDQE